MLRRAKGFLQARSTVPADFKQAIGKLGGMFVFVLHSFGEY